jgi:hypothetical protein
VLFEIPLGQGLLPGPAHFHPKDCGPFGQGKNGTITELNRVRLFDDIYLVFFGEMWFFVAPIEDCLSVFGFLIFSCSGCSAYCFGFSLLAFPCFLIGILALPLCGAALTFFAAAKKVSKESGLKPPACRCPPLA